MVKRVASLLAFTLLATLLGCSSGPPDTGPEPGTDLPEWVSEDTSASLTEEPPVAEIGESIDGPEQATAAARRNLADLLPLRARVALSLYLRDATIPAAQTDAIREAGQRASVRVSPEAVTVPDAVRDEEAGLWRAYAQVPFTTALEATQALFVSAFEATEELLPPDAEEVARVLLEALGRSPAPSRVIADDEPDPVDPTLPLPLFPEGEASPADGSHPVGEGEAATDPPMPDGEDPGE